MRPSIRQPNSQVRQYFGKFRAKVEENIDPLFLGRIVAKIAIMPDVVLNWCMPCVPYAGMQVGFYAIPPIGANVWIEFEGGDLNFPIWTGCFWGEGEVPVATPEPPNPLVKVWKTEFATFIMNDTPEIGGIEIQCTPPSVNDILTIKMDALGITISAPPATITMIPEEGITLTFPPDVIAMNEGGITATVPPSVLTINEGSIDVVAPAISATAEGEISMTAGAALTAEAGAEVSVSAGAALEITATAEMSLTAVLININ